MGISAQRTCLKAVVEATLESFSRARFRTLTFPAPLETRLEQDTRHKRSHRMWSDGLIALIGFNLCLVLDFLFVKDGTWISILRQTALITPVALAVNAIVRSNPAPWLREGSVASGMFAICLINLLAEGTASTASTLFGAICILITALFVGVVMRLRFPYVLATLAAMLVAGLWFLGHTRHLRFSETIVADSMVAVGLTIILVASRSLEYEERNSFLLGLQHDLQAEELAWANQTLKELSSIDNLTRLPNRRALDQRVEEAWAQCTEQQKPLSVVIIDVDHFKYVNDTHGHIFGDEVLRHIGALLPQALRSAQDMAARFGGEEFVLLLPDARPEAALAVAQQVRFLVESAAPHHTPNPTPVTVSCGVSTVLPGGPLQWTNLIASADDALYLAKGSGRNCVKFSRCVEPAPVPNRIVEHAAARISRGFRSLSRPRLSAAPHSRSSASRSAAAI